MNIPAIIGLSFLGLILLLLLVLLVRVGFYAELVYTKKEGFKFVGKITWGPFVINIDRFLKKDAEKTAKNAETEEKEKLDDEKKTYNTVEIIKNGAGLAYQLSDLPGKVLIFKKQCVWCKVALKDPMKNGIVYGALSGALISAVQNLVCRFKTEEYKVRVTPDFLAGDGISIKNVTWLQLRPLVLIICFLIAYTKNPLLREAIKNLKESINKNKKEERSEA